MTISVSRVYDAQLLSLCSDAYDALAESDGESADLASLLDWLSSGGEQARQVFGRACRFEGEYSTSWIHRDSGPYGYLSIDVAEAAFDPAERRRLYSSILQSPNPAIPYDYRARVAKLLMDNLDNATARELRATGPATPIPLRGRHEKVRMPTDGIDHLFPIPETSLGKISLLRQAARRKTAESISLLRSRVLGSPCEDEPDALHPQPQDHRSHAAEQLIAHDVDNDLIHPNDYLVQWDQVLTEPVDEQHGGLTLAELARMTLMCTEFKLPDIKVRPPLVEFYRAAYRSSGRSVIGLSAGVFHVEHGLESTPSYLYIGRDAVMGKGCTIDCVGGAVLQRKSFLGGGYMPILIHTHKHLRPKGGMASDERKRILPSIFVAEAGARLPMSAVGLFECADHVGREEPLYPGIRVLEIGDRVAN